VTEPVAMAAQRDRDDVLSDFRRRFHIPPGPDRGPSVYLCGNSLGLEPRNAETVVKELLKDWRRYGVEGHFKGRRPWMPYHEQFAEPLAELTGAKPSEVVCMNTLTVNLHLMMVSFYRPSKERYRILIEKPAFPSDRYAVESQVRFHGLDPDDALLEAGPREGESIIRDGDILEIIERQGDSIALVMLPGVQYYSGQRFDMAGITSAARARGCRVGWDLAHAVGNVPLSLHDWDADFAVWCSYKYLNGGPGAIAGCFVHERHATEPGLPRFAGWWGHDKATRFEMGAEFRPAPGAEGWQVSNPPIFSMAPLIASLELFTAAGMERLAQKSRRLTGWLEELLETRLADRVEILTPGKHDQRGCQLSLRIRAGNRPGHQVFQQLTEAGVIVDWREPDVIRVAPVPLYNTFDDVRKFVTHVEEATA
jgi:kynureninase